MTFADVDVTSALDDTKRTERLEFAEKTIPVAEIFGSTIQGEGALAGRPTYFLRVGGCDYKCHWCDTDQAVLPEMVRGLERLTQIEIYHRLLDWKDEHPGPQWLTISGGNPAMYDLSLVVMEWQKNPAILGKVAVETQGSRWQPWLKEVDLLTISPKPPSSGMPQTGQFTSMQTLRNFMEYFYPAEMIMAIESGMICLKVVVFDDADYEFARSVHRAYPDVPFYLSTGTAMGGLSSKWVPPPHDGEIEGPVKRFRERQDLSWVRESTPTDTKDSLLARYRWLAGWQAIRDYSFDRQGQAIVARADSMASRLGQVHADDSRLRSTLDSAIREIRTLRESAGAAGSDGEQLDLLEARLDSIQRRVAPFLDQGPPPP